MLRRSTGKCQADASTCQNARLIYLTEDPLKPNQSICREACHDAEVAKYWSIERRVLASRVQRWPQANSQYSVNGHHLLDARPPFTSNEDFAAYTEHTLDRAAVDIDIGAVQVAQGFLYAVCPRFTHRPCTAALFRFVQANRQSKFERHIESGRGRSSPIELNPGKVVKGVSAISNQVRNAVESTAAEWHFQGGPRNEAKRNDCRYVG